MIPDFDVNPPEDPPLSEQERDCEHCGDPRADLETGLCWRCAEAEKECRAMEEEAEKHEAAYWRHINSKIDEARGK